MFLAMLSLALLSNVLVDEVCGHGRLIEPPSRASMWRYGFDTPHDYNDHESYCGGFSRQWQRNGGKCGICGDAWDLPTPRPHETGGKYGNSVIARRYRTGSVIPIHVQLTANHHGYFIFHICPMTARGQEVTAECLEQHVLAGENGTTKYYPGPGNRIFESFYKLPENLTCAQCVLQWRYVAGNNWGDCGDGTGAVGCGPQEEFRACADIAIGDSEATLPPHPVTPETQPTTGSPSSEDVAVTPTKPVPESNIFGPSWLVNLIISGTCLLVVLALLALLYAYYYHSGKAKKWLMAGRLLKASPPVAPPRHKKQDKSVLHAPLQV